MKNKALAIRIETDKTIKWQIKKQKRSVYNRIKEAAAYGKYSTYYMDLVPATIDWLGKEGFRVEKDPLDEQRSYKISWEAERSGN